MRISDFQLRMVIAVINGMSIPDREAELRRILEAMPYRWVWEAREIANEILTQREAQFKKEDEEKAARDPNIGNGLLKVRF